MCGFSSSEGGLASEPSAAVVPAAAPGALPAGGSSDLPPGWSEHVSLRDAISSDCRSGHHPPGQRYWVHVDGRATWDRPQNDEGAAVAVTEPSPCEPAAVDAGGDDDDDDDDVSPTLSIGDAAAAPATQASGPAEAHIWSQGCLAAGDALMETRGDWRIVWTEAVDAKLAELVRRFEFDFVSTAEALATWARIERKFDVHVPLLTGRECRLRWAALDRYIALHAEQIAEPGD